MRKTVLLSVLTGAMALTTACEETPTTMAARSPAPSAAARQLGPGAGGERMKVGRDPLQRLLAQREELGLSDAQVARLRQIQADLQARNEPLVARLRAAMGRGEGDRQALRDLDPEQREAKLREMREARRKKLEQMTPEQRQELRERLRAEREELRPVLEQLRGNTREALASAREVLTAAQQAKLKEMLEARRAAHGERGRPRQGMPAGHGPGGQGG